MIVIDSSALVSILWREPGFEALMKAIQSADHRLGARLLFKGQDFARTDLAAAA